MEVAPPDGAPAVQTVLDVWPQLTLDGSTLTRLLVLI
jgi:hypothetical protein